MGGPRPHSKPDGAHLAQRRAPLAVGKTLRLVSPATRSGPLSSPAEEAAAGLPAVSESLGAASQARTSRKDDRIIDKTRPVRSAALER